jgi:MFS family permease
LLSRVRDPSLRIVYLTILILGVAYGLAVSIVAVFLESRGVDKLAIGSLAIFFAGGIALGSLPAGALVKRFTPKRVLVVALLGFATAAILFPLGKSFAAYATARFFDGFFSVGVWVSSETILLARAPREDKAYCTSLYAISLAAGYVIGPIVAYLIVPAIGRPATFVTAGGLALATAAFVAVFLRGGPAHDEATSGEGSGLPALEILRRIRASCLATFSYGYFQASVVLFLPLFLIQRGMSERETVILPAFFAAGMLLFSNYAARLGDRHGHLAVMRALGVVGTIAILSFLAFRASIPLYTLVFVAGASLASVSPVSLALQGLVTPAEDLPRAGGFYNASYALGMLIGPVISAWLFQQVSGAAMVLHYAILWAVFIVATIVWRRDDPHARRA